MLGGIFRNRSAIEIYPMLPADCAEASLLHGERFARQWSDGEIHGLLGQKTVLGFVARQSNIAAGGPIAGFVLARVAAGEAEVLTVAVREKHARQGIGWRLMQAAIREIAVRDGETVFLEVDEGNEPAIGLYHRFRFQKVAERKAYYEHDDGRRSTALVMRLDIQSRGGQ